MLFYLSVVINASMREVFRSSMALGLAIIFCMAIPEFSYAVPEIKSIRVSNNKLSKEQMAGIILRIDSLYKSSHTDRHKALIKLADVYYQCVRHNFNFGSGYALGAVGSIYHNLGKLESSISIYHKAIEYFKLSDQFSKFGITKTYGSIANTYFELGQYDSSAIYCYRILNIYRKAPEENSNIIMASMMLGLNWLRLQQYDQAMHYIIASEKLAIKHKKRKLLMQIQLNKAAIFIEQKKFDTANYIIQGLLNSTNKNDDQRFESPILTQLARLSAEKGNYKQSLIYFKKSLEKAFDEGQLINAFVNISITYYQIKKYDSAMYFAKLAERHAIKASMKDQFPIIYRSLSAIHAKKGSFKEAFYNADEYIGIYDSVMGNKRFQALTIMEENVRTAQKDEEISNKQLQIVQKDNQIYNQYIWIGGVSLGALLLAGLSFSLYRSNLHKQRLQKEQVRNYEQEQEIGQLKALMSGEEKERARIARELHDGFISQLSAIKINLSYTPERHQSLIEDKEYRDNIKHLDDTINDLRKTAHNLMPDVLVLGGLSEAIQSFCDRVSNSCQLAIDFQLYGYVPRFDVDFELALYRMVQEMVQNIIKHAHATQALVQINCNEQVLSITIEDNGIGIDENNVKGGGLQTLDARVKALNGYVEIKSQKNNGTTIYFEFDLRFIKKQTEHAY